MDIAFEKLSEAKIGLIHHDGSVCVPAFSSAISFIAVELKFDTKSHEISAIDEFNVVLKSASNN